MGRAKHIAEELEIEFPDGKFNFSNKWLFKFKLANDINRVQLHGEGADAAPASVAIVRTQLPMIMSGIPHEQIYNFDETSKHPCPYNLLYMYILLAYEALPQCMPCLLPTSFLPNGAHCWQRCRQAQRPQGRENNQGPYAKILPLDVAQSLELGIRHDNRATPSEAPSSKACVPPTVIT